MSKTKDTAADLATTDQQEQDQETSLNKSAKDVKKKNTKAATTTKSETKKKAEPTPKPPKPEYISQSGLLSLGWTPTLIKKLLPEPKEVPNPHYRSAAPMKLWIKPDVLALMETDAYKEAVSSIAKRRETIANKKAKKKEEMDQSILQLTPTNPIDDYPKARSIKRKFVLHVGPTNSGKTHDSLERLKTAKCGTYLGPLRLLALEVSDRFNSDGVPCSMITGEEELEVPGATIMASTIEMLDVNTHYDVAVVDEVQMIQDRDRGHSWTKAILGLYADEIHLCMAPEAEELAIKLINECGDEYEVHKHKRATPLEFDQSNVTVNNVEPGDALIVFSRRAVLQLSAELEHKGTPTSVIYGNLPPVTRREQVRKFAEGESKVVVSTDAIGMGINLPIRRVIFWETEKFDGTSVRPLKVPEIKQIAGRAGRFGMFEKGVVLAADSKGRIKEALTAGVNPIEVANLGFNERLLGLPYTLPEIISAWSDLPVAALYKKTSVENMLELYKILDRNTEVIKNCSKQEVYRMITCSINPNNETVVGWWKKYCIAYDQRNDLKFPRHYGDGLSELEDYYHCLDLYYQFGRKMHMPIDTERLAEEKAKTASKINEILLRQKKQYAKKCKACGKHLPSKYPYGYCESCYNRMRRDRYDYYDFGGFDDDDYY